MIAFNFLRDPLHPSLERALGFRLPAQWYPVAIAMAAVALFTLGSSAVDAYRQKAATAMQHRAELRFEASRMALSRERLEWQKVDRLIVQDRRLRELRLSGSAAALRVTRIGNALPSDAWLTSVSAQTGGIDLKGDATGLAALSASLENVRRDRTLGRAERLAFSGDRHATGRIAFQLHVTAR